MVVSDPKNEVKQSLALRGEARGGNCSHLDPHFPQT
jgi:hypothetical protein